MNKSKEEISVQNRFKKANELPQRVTEMKLQCTIVLYSIKLLPRRGQVTILQCVHPSRGPHIAFCKQHSRRLTSCDFFLWDYLKSKVSSWGPDVDDLKGRHVTDCAEHSWTR
ncbi:hypothetical protein AVEN_94295-1 [Araneus ventricosus]|uniref:Uncharacterized protein n=1 Tax=Araneus ventricosus TaxID=182803 RepID=A0A4Y2I895_ARAVE|nr:hypothetical protein AVEN_94295-1 [Araneus ventricosus]